MKIGVLTFHNAINFGAVLQTYATQELLKGMGHSVEIIDYHNSYIDAYYEKNEFSFKKFLTLNPKSIVKSIIVPILYSKRKRRYDAFLRNLNLTERYFQGEITGYDVILIGSDQVWSIKHTDGFDRMYWGLFDTPADTKKIAWSACMGDEYTKYDKKEIARLLSNFDKISVREASLKDYLMRITNKDITVTLDPTLVVNKAVWNKFCKPVDNTGYILVYAVKFLSETITVANKISKIYGKKVKIISAYPGRPFSLKVIEGCGPQDFLSYIKNASLVITSSFHGAVFSILFEKDFVSVIPEGKKNQRVSDLLYSLNLSNRIISSPNAIERISKIDYSNINILLEEKKAETLDFLKSSLLVS